MGGKMIELYLATFYELFSYTHKCYTDHYLFRDLKNAFGFTEIVFETDIEYNNLYIRFLKDEKTKKTLIINNYTIKNFDDAQTGVNYFEALLFTKYAENVHNYMKIHELMFISVILEEFKED